MTCKRLVLKVMPGQNELAVGAPLRALSICSLLALALSACASVPRETIESVTAREKVLLSVTSSFGTIYESSGDDAVTWADRGTLLLTPTSLYFVSGTTRTLSYAMVTGASIRSLPDMLGFVRGKKRDNLLAIEVSRPVCQKACVFNLVDDPGKLAEAIEIIGSGRKHVDPFGRIDGPQSVWVAAGIRNSRFWWSEEPAYLQASKPEAKRQLDEKFCAHLDCRGSGSSATAYGEGWRELLIDSPTEGYQFRALPGVVLNQRAELNTRVLAKLLTSEDPSVNALLVSDITAVTLRERVSADYEVSVELTVRSFVDYFDLDPFRDGHYFWHEYKTTRSLNEWLAADSFDFTNVLKTAAQQAGCKVLADLNSQVSRTPSVCSSAMFTNDLGTE
jgi:hypothetical protein